VRRFVHSANAKKLHEWERKNLPGLGVNLGAFIHPLVADVCVAALNLGRERGEKDGQGVGGKELCQ
jgi:hypothetical protein